jgi:Domain of unknown function (DUF5668)
MSSPVVAPPRRRRSMGGPVVLIILGLIFLLGNLRLISWKHIGLWFAHYWPLLLILWGVLKLVEYYQAKREGGARTGCGRRHSAGVPDYRGADGEPIGQRGSGRNPRSN